MIASSGVSIRRDAPQLGYAMLFANNETGPDVGRTVAG
jgi:hypothetical protein